MQICILTGGDALDFRTGPERPRPALRLLQPSATATGGGMLCHDLRAEDETLTLSWPRLSQGQASALRAWWLALVGMAGTFELQLDSAEATTYIPVRFAEPELRMLERPGGAVECTIVLLKEPT